MILTRPLSIELAGDNRQLIISGPNTGGKTVALKTVGLLALMAQSGIPVPAAVKFFIKLHVAGHAECGTIYCEPGRKTVTMWRRAPSPAATRVPW